MRKLILIWVILSSILILPIDSFSQLKTYQFEQIDSLQKIEKRKLVIFINTPWCNYCKMMQNTSLKNQNVISLLNNQYYFIDLNAEEKRNIHFKGQSYSFMPNGMNTGIHTLAEQLGTINKEISYPTLTILNVDNEIIFQFNQLLKSTELNLVLNSLQ